MSIATGLLLVGALGIILVMHFVGHGGHGEAHGAQEAEGADITSAPDQGDKSADAEQPGRGKHGCC